MMRPVKTIVKVATASALYYLGILQLWRRLVLRNRAVVLMYHRVLNNEERDRSGSLPGMIVSETAFARQMAFLKRHFVVLNIDEFTDRLTGNAGFPPSSCLVTFDDGWLDNYTRALPILRRHDLPALVFLPVNFIGQSRMFWREELTHLLVRCVLTARHDATRRERMRAVLRSHGLDVLLDLADHDPRPTVRDAIADRTELRVPAAETLIDGLAAILGARTDARDTPDRFVDWRQVGEMAACRVTFGGHGAEHRQLGELAAAEAEAEITTAAQVVPRETTAAVPAFSYPNGSMTPSVAALVRNAGYRLAFTTEPGTVGAGDNPYALRRVNIHEDSTSSEPMFLARLVGLF